MGLLHLTGRILTHSNTDRKKYLQIGVPMRMRAMRSVSCDAY
jgi:hypothetical protein